MSDAVHRLEGALGRWRRRRVTVALLRSAAVVLPWIVGAWSAAAHGLSTLAGSAGLGGLVVATWAWRRWRPLTADVAMMARHLDRLHPELEESSELLLAAAGDLPLVGRLQQARVSGRLGEEGLEIGAPSWRGPLAWLGLSALGCLLMPALTAWAVATPGEGMPWRRTTSTVATAMPPAVEAVSVRVRPPGYTGQAERTLSALDLTVEAGSRLDWRIEVNGAVTEARMVFDERESVVLERAPDGALVAARRAIETHLYRLELLAPDGSVVGGDFHRLEVIVDHPPELAIVRPPRFVELPREPGQQLDIVVEARDDYGLGPVVLVATVASGFGELVEFRERRLDFERRDSLGDGSWRYSSRLDLDALGVEPGVELFFFAEGEDRRRPEPQRARSSTHIVRMPGDSTRSVGLSSRLPILRVPEFFRSQRQIILDTERLLAEEPTITEAEFRRRSESLGFDQRALRLRYGGLLGEEFESGRPAGVDDEAEEHVEELRRLDEMEPGGGGKPKDVREALEALPQGMAHQHDSAEISTYFDSEIKAQLKAALEEMWGAEGGLRSIEPRRALPFEYRALTLLKWVQQRSRLYVQKIGFEAPVLYPDEKRLTGELDDIRTRRRRGVARGEDDSADTRRALTALTGGPMPESGELLAAARAAAGRLAERARRDPDLDLGGLESLRGWITTLEEGTEPSPEVVSGATAALWWLLPEPATAPALPAAGLTALGESYRRRLTAGDSP